VDGTLVTHPHGKVVWQILNERFLGTDRVNEDRYARYSKGEITYAEWVALDVGDWMRAGATKEEVVEEIGALRLVDGARETLAALKDAGCRLAVISGTLDVCLDVLFPDHPFDEVFTNRIRFGEDGSIAGWDATPFDMDGKARALEAIAAREGIPLERTAFVGDHANDIAAARRAGFAVAFNPKSEDLAAVAHLVVHDPDLRTLLPYLMEPPAPERRRAGPTDLEESL
jgi:HAD superfamily phosphoserine phosphatase-like hydrolase